MKVKSVSTKISLFILLMIGLTFVFLQPVQASSNTIKDIDESSGYAKASISVLAEKSIIQGDENGNFMPQETVTRARMITMLVKAMGISTENLPATPTFRDVPSTHWAFPYVEAAVREGITAGISSDMFGIDNICTREQMAVMIIRAGERLVSYDNDKAKINSLQKFDDRIMISDWAREAIGLSVDNGLMAGTSEKTFEPKGKAKMEMAAVVLDRLLTLDEKLSTSADELGKIITRIMQSKENTVTLGSSEEEVLQVMGKPKKTYTNNYFGIVYMEYDQCVLYLNYNLNYPSRVIGWVNRGSSKISLGYQEIGSPFQIGSSMNDVSDAMGAPKFIPPKYSSRNSDYWIYPDDSMVLFDKNRKVIGYINKGSLRVSIGEKNPAAQAISHKSSRLDVVKAMGTPDAVNSYLIHNTDYAGYNVVSKKYENHYIDLPDAPNDKYTWYEYGDSIVGFNETGKLVTLINNGNLKAEFQKAEPGNPGLKFDSNEDEIIKAMGTPDKITADYNWHYNESIIYVGYDGIIRAWTNNGNLAISSNDASPDAPAISIGSTKKQVAEALGTPPYMRYNYWKYGETEISFNGQGTVEWIYRPYGIKLSSSVKNENSRGFNIGSSADEVMEAMGYPKRVARDGFNNQFITWIYGLNNMNDFGQFKVHFDNNGKVKYWTSFSNDSVKVKLSPSPLYNPSAPAVTIGSTAEDVMRAMGNPTSWYPTELGDGYWFYGDDYFKFDANGKVIGWNSSNNRLKVTAGEKVEGYVFTLGSTQDDVVKAMGTPGSTAQFYNEIKWSYEGVWIGFDPETKKVQSWTDISKIKVVEPKVSSSAMIVELGSSFDDVIHVMGLPDRIDYGTYSTEDYIRWTYGSSFIEFNMDGKVKSWNNAGLNLKTK